MTEGQKREEAAVAWRAPAGALDGAGDFAIPLALPVAPLRRFAPVVARRPLGTAGRLGRRRGVVAAHLISGDRSGGRARGRQAVLLSALLIGVFQALRRQAMSARVPATVPGPTLARDKTIVGTPRWRRLFGCPDLLARPRVLRIGRRGVRGRRRRRRLRRGWSSGRRRHQRCSGGRRRSSRGSV